MEAVSMNNLYNANGKINVFGWIIFIATVTLILYSVYQCYANVKKMQKDEDIENKKIKELEMNLREVMRTQYKTLA